jgi:hypothetical protein
MIFQLLIRMTAVEVDGSFVRYDVRAEKSLRREDLRLTGQYNWIAYLSMLRLERVAGLEC